MYACTVVTVTLPLNTRSCPLRASIIPSELMFALMVETRCPPCDSMLLMLTLVGPPRLRKRQRARAVDRCADARVIGVIGVIEQDVARRWRRRSRTPAPLADDRPSEARRKSCGPGTAPVSGSGCSSQLAPIGHVAAGVAEPDERSARGLSPTSGGKRCEHETAKHPSPEAVPHV